MKHVTPPVESPSASATRALIEAVAQATPITAALARLYQYTHPSHDERERDRALHDVIEAVNNLQQQEMIGGLSLHGHHAFGHGISSITDEGTGSFFVRFTFPKPSNRYHVNVSSAEGTSNVETERDGFRILLQKNGRPFDTDFSFVVKTAE